jgi:hypothetical protein
LALASSFCPSGTRWLAGWLLAAVLFLDDGKFFFIEFLVFDLKFCPISPIKGKKSCLTVAFTPSGTRWLTVFQPIPPFGTRSYPYLGGIGWGEEPLRVPTNRPADKKPAGYNLAVTSSFRAARVGRALELLLLVNLATSCSDLKIRCKTSLLQFLVCWKVEIDAICLRVVVHIFPDLFCFFKVILRTRE